MDNNVICGILTDDLISEITSSTHEVERKTRGCFSGDVESSKLYISMDVGEKSGEVSIHTSYTEYEW